MTAVETKQKIVNAIRSTILQLEDDPEVGPDDPAIDTLKRMLLRRITELSGLEEKAAGTENARMLPGMLSKTAE
jgi:hypothetical protein